jgi:shikimate kinase
MGCGKSTMGRALAAALQLKFIDLDHYLEDKFLMTIPQIFALEGEEAFRKKEQSILQEVSSFDNVVVATGGGAPCFFDNMELMNQTGTCIFLDVDTETLVHRLIKSKTERPIIKGRSPMELGQFIDEMMLKRRPYYERARHILKGSEIKPTQVIELLQQIYPD